MSVLSCNNVNNERLICEHGKDCTFNCDETECLQSGSIHADTAKNLYIFASADRCMENARVYLPIHGNATFEQTGEQCFEQMKVFAGSNTQSIIIDCTDNNPDNWHDCKNIRV